MKKIVLLLFLPLILSQLAAMDEFEEDYSVNQTKNSNRGNRSEREEDVGNAISADNDGMLAMILGYIDDKYFQSAVYLLNNLIINSDHSLSQEQIITLKELKTYMNQIINCMEKFRRYGIVIKKFSYPWIDYEAPTLKWILHMLSQVDLRKISEETAFSESQSNRKSSMNRNPAPPKVQLVKEMESTITELKNIISNLRESYGKEMLKKEVLLKVPLNNLYKALIEDSRDTDRSPLARSR
ncbi:MAG: hypothetical protein LBF57_00370 [Holosporaceae bacterium]|jgi:hypothetical protein|nr:hypothetical protein [Holosporaceae bacterium]